MFFKELNVAKGIAILLVLLGHSFILYPVNMLDVKWCDWMYHVIYSFHMPVFFFVSGLLFANSSHHQYGYILKSKAMRLLLPYLSYHAINLGVKILLPNLVNRKVGTIYDYCESILLRGGELWFLYVLLIIFLLWGFILPTTKEKITVYVYTGIILCISQSGLSGDMFLYKDVIYYSFFFLLGYITKDCYKEHRNWLVQKAQILSVIFLLLFAIVNVALVYEWGAMKFIPALTGSCLCLILSVLVCKSSHLGRILDYCGKYSLQFYFFNGFMLVISRVLVVQVLHVNNSVLMVTGIFALCVLTEVACIEITKRLPFIKVLFGF